LRLQKVDRKAFHLPKPYFNFGPTPGIASVILKVLHLYQKNHIFNKLDLKFNIVLRLKKYEQDHNAGKKCRDGTIYNIINIRNIFYPKRRRKET
jgi:hypothetical protein